MTSKFTLIEDLQPDCSYYKLSTRHTFQVERNEREPSQYQLNF